MATVYTIEDLEKWESQGCPLDPTPHYAVLGDPIAHSLSPAMQQAALEACQIRDQYIALHITPENLSSALDAMRKLKFAGANLTIPHKESALKLVEADSQATEMGAVNTIVLEDDQWVGTNTDGPGFMRAIREEFSVDLKDLRVLILGAGGGAGRAVAVQCAREGCERLLLVNRTLEKAQALVSELQHHFAEDRLLGPVERLEAVAWEESALEVEMGQVDLIVNATPIGMKRLDPELIASTLFQPHHLVFDMIYSPPQTRLLREAAQDGARVANGLSMLLHQGALAFEFWHGQDAPLAEMRRALLKFHQ